MVALPEASKYTEGLAHTAVGFVVSITVTICWHVFVFELASVTVQSTVVVPTG